MPWRIIFCWLILGLFPFCSAFAAGKARDASLPVTLVFHEAPLSGVLQALADFRRLNLMVSDEVQGKTTLRLVGVPWEQALQAIARQHDLAVERQDGILFVQSAARVDSRRAARRQPAASGVLKQLRVMLQQAEAEEVAKSLLQQKGGLLSERGSVSADGRTNMLLVSDEPHQLAAIEAWLKEVDQTVPQVQLRAHIITINRESLRELGVRWGVRPDDDGSSDGRFRVNQFSMGIPLDGKSLSGGFQIARIGGNILELELAALEQQDKVEIIASPHLMTENLQTASIKQGTEIPYEVSSGASGATAIEFKEAVLGMEVTPRVVGSDRITLALQISQNMPGRTLKQQEGEVLAIDKQEIRTRVTVRNGETVVLGGIFQQQKERGNSAVPGLGRLPGLGALFRDERNRQQRRELVIFITPELVQARKVPSS